MKTRTRWGMLSVLLLSALAGCSLGDNDDFQRDKLNQARTQWDGKNVSSYTYILELQCFCAPASQLEPVLVTVQNGAVTSLQYWDEDPEDRTPAPASVFGAYDTVEDLFAFVAAAISQNADVLQVGYDAEYGFPNIVNVDYQAGGNDQVLLFVSEFTATP